VKLAIIRQRYDPHGGAERFVSRAVEALTDRGAEVSVISRQWKDGSAQTRWIACDPFYLGRVWRDRGFSREACNIVKNGNFDLVQSHERIACCDIYRAGDGVHAQWLLHRAKTLDPWRRFALTISPFHRHLISAERRMFSSARLRAVICNSNMVRDEIAHWFPSVSAKLHVIHNGVNLDLYHPETARQQRDSMRDRLGVSRDARILLFVGSGFERKGVKVLLDGFRRVVTPTDFLVVVGRDRHAHQYEAEAKSMGLADQVRWAGPQADIVPWYGLADAFVLPTLYDPFPNAALEALACGLPVVTTSRCGTAEIIREGWNGFVCRDPADPSELAIALRKVLDQGLQMGVNARISAEPLSLQNMAQALLNVYDALNGFGQDNA
jgi:UDP-glucose:(heptosyl)LPS alpha-1,3-glucosyltransferase